MDNKNLYWYGFGANLKSGIGKFLIVIGIFFGLMSMLANFFLGLIILIAFIGFGIYLLATGSSQRFDYQRQSGNIIHGGDNFR